jgi:hypothetical protein
MQFIVMYATGISIYLKSVERYKFLILDTYHSDTLHLLQQGWEYPWSYFEAKWSTQAKEFEKHCTRRCRFLFLAHFCIKNQSWWRIYMRHVLMSWTQSIQTLTDGMTVMSLSASLQPRQVQPHFLYTKQH